MCTSKLKHAKPTIDQKTTTMDEATTNSMAAGPSMQSLVKDNILSVAANALLSTEYMPQMAADASVDIEHTSAVTTYASANNEYTSEVATNPSVSD